MEAENRQTEGIQKKKNFISGKADAFFISIFDVYKFIVRFFKEAFLPPYEIKEVMRQCYDFRNGCQDTRRTRLRASYDNEARAYAQHI